MPLMEKIGRPSSMTAAQQKVICQQQIGASDRGKHYLEEILRAWSLMVIILAQDTFISCIGCSPHCEKHPSWC